MAITVEVPGTLNVAALIASGAISASALTSTGNVTATGKVTITAIAGDEVIISRASIAHTTDSGTSTETLTALIPAGVVLFGVVARVITILAGAGPLVSFDVGDAGDLARYGTAIVVAADTTIDETNWTADPAGTWSASARNIVLTATAGQFDSGVIRVAAFYHDFTAPTQ